LETAYPPKIIDKGTAVVNSKIKEENVLLVENLKPNLLSVSQTCDQGHICIFDSEKCEIKNKKSGKVVSIAMRNTNNVYTLQNENQCYLSMVEESWLWHRKLGHLGFDNLAKISNEGKLSDSFWREVVYIVVYTLNKAQLGVKKDKTPYELW